ncbi:EpsG family protein [Zestomonas thermotolerans]|uniref:EpsG family protein n=1 Tax=Zestomonas thermotolerans TaxID=157784 RepID=UPI0023F278CA|nr:EpsG family protein [Pseudomonas thermotolerans]
MGFLALLIVLLLFSLQLIISRGGLIFSGHKLELPQAFFCITFLVPIFIYGLFFIAFRPLDAGFDTARYVEAYLSLSDVFSARSTGASVYGNTELLWWPFQTIFSEWLGGRGWLVANYIMVFLLVFWAYIPLGRKYEVSPLIFSLVFLTYFFVYSGNTMRQAVALPFALVAFCSFFDKKYLRFLLYSAVAVGFHWSAIVFLFSPIMRLPIFNRRLGLIFAPLGLFLMSIFFADFAKLFVDLVGMPELRVKYELYIESGRVSHVGDVWTKLNFWLCILAGFLFLFVWRSEKQDNVLYAYVSFILGLILFGVSISDFSERFFPALFLVFPLIVTLILRRLKWPKVVSEGVLHLMFLLMGLMVLANHSAQETLGYDFTDFFEGL